MRSATDVQIVRPNMVGVPDGHDGGHGAQQSCSPHGHSEASRAYAARRWVHVVGLGVRSDYHGWGGCNGASAWGFPVMGRSFWPFERIMGRLGLSGRVIMGIGGASRGGCPAQVSERYARRVGGGPAS